MNLPFGMRSTSLCHNPPLRMFLTLPSWCCTLSTEWSDRGAQCSWASTATVLVLPLVLPATLKELISRAMIRWAQDQIQDAELVRMMFNLLRGMVRQHRGAAAGVRRTYTISQASVATPSSLLAALGQIRCLLSVRDGAGGGATHDPTGWGGSFPSRASLQRRQFWNPSHIKTSGFPILISLLLGYMLIKQSPSITSETRQWATWGEGPWPESRKESWKKQIFSLNLIKIVPGKQWKIQRKGQCVQPNMRETFWAPKILTGNLLRLPFE